VAFRQQPWAFFFLTFLVLHPALAEPTASDRETARSLLNEGDKKVASKDYQAALRAYQAAHNIMGVPSTGIEVVRVQVILGMLLEARDITLQITRYPIRSGEPTAFARARSDAEDLARQLALRIGAVRVVVHGVTPGKDVNVTIGTNTVAPGAISLPYKVNPGSHVVTAKAIGYKSARAEVVIREGETKDVSLSLTPAPGSTESSVPTSPMSPPPVALELGKKTTSPWVYVGFGLATAGVAVGTVTGILSLQKTAQAKDQCDNTVCPPAAGNSIDRAKSFATISNLSFAAGLVGIGVGITGLIVGGGTSKTSQSAAKVYPVIDVNRMGIAGSFLFTQFSHASEHHHGCYSFRQPGPRFSGDYTVYGTRMPSYFWRQ